MWVDNELYFTGDTGQAITATAVSTNSIDLGEPRDIGVGAALMIVSLLTVAMTDAGSDSTITVTLETDDNSGFSSALVAQTLYVFAALDPIGTIKAAYIAHGAMDERFARLRYTTANGNLTTGTFKSFITKDVQAWKAYADAVTIS